MKRFTFVALLAAGMLVCATWSASFAAGQKRTFKLYPPAGSPFPHASGSVVLALYYPGMYALDSVSVWRLAPNTWYHMPLTAFDPHSGVFYPFDVTFQTDARGNSKSGGGPVLIGDNAFKVYDLSSGTLVLAPNY